MRRFCQKGGPLKGWCERSVVVSSVNEARIGEVWYTVMPGGGGECALDTLHVGQKSRDPKRNIAL